MWYPNIRGRVMGFVTMGNNFGGLSIPLLIGFSLADNNWRIAYFELGFISLLLVLLTIFFVHEPSIIFCSVLPYPRLVQELCRGLKTSSQNTPKSLRKRLPGQRWRVGSAKVFGSRVSEKMWRRASITPFALIGGSQAPVGRFR